MTPLGAVMGGLLEPAQMMAACRTTVRREGRRRRMRGGHRMFGWGNLGRDPEVKYTSEGKAVCRFSVAIDEYKGKTEWINVVCFDKTAEACGKYLTKGQPVVFDGRLSTSSWEKDGVKHYKTECVATNVQFLGGPKDEGTPF